MRKRHSSNRQHSRCLVVVDVVGPEGIVEPNIDQLKSLIGTVVNELNKSSLSFSGNGKK